MWRIKYNDELCSFYKQPSTVNMIKTARLKWLRHIVKMEDYVPCRKITISQPEGSRKKGRPGLRWLGSLLKGLKTFKVNARWKKAGG
jgi:hypothetical protein